MEDLFSAFDGAEQLPASSAVALSGSSSSSQGQRVVRKAEGDSEVREGAVKRRRVGSDGDDAAVKSNPGPEAMEVDAGQVKATVAVPARKENHVPAKMYQFELDGFQKESIGYLERNESVLVAAHTSAGKTVVAEYAIAMALRDGKRVVYTSPIKALSNQKYRDLADEFSDVGLMTGDVTINPNASCLVMTTEILRSMLYRGSEVIREVAYAIFDEVHYMRDKERGVIWEEAILLLPHKVRFVFLSATIPNAQQFCDWISKTHFQPCHAVYTDFRPTPLQHFVYPSGSDGVYMVVNEKGRFDEQTFEKAMATISTSNLEDEIMDGSGRSKEARKRIAARRRGKMGDLLSIVQMIMQRQYDPAIVFSFSKRDCEKYAAQVSKLSLNTSEDKQMVRQVFKNAIDSLSEDDKTLPQVQSLLPLLEKGIGIHHGGLLPILKEVTEILFGEGLIKVLFATETFAMGINMPAKTVVFTAMRKFDGSDLRYVSPGEYIQMSGRAGRRGLDERGIVILMIDEKIETSKAKEIMSGLADPLSSRFYLTYNMLLNLMRVEDADPEYVIRNSLYTFQQEQELPKLEQSLAESERVLRSLEVEQEEDLAEYHYLKNKLVEKEKQIAALVFTPAIAEEYLKEGRLIRLGGDWGIVAVLETVTNQRSNQIEGVRVVSIADSEDSTSPFVEPAEDSTTKQRRKEALKFTIPAVKVFSLSDILEVSSLRIKMPKRTGKQNDAATAQIFRSLQEVKRRHPNGLPMLHPFDDMRLENEKLRSLLENRQQLAGSLSNNPISKIKYDAKRKKLMGKYMEKYNLSQQVASMKGEVKEKRSLPMKDKLKAMKLVLRRLGHVNKDYVIELKGRVGCEISTADELVTTELLLGGAFNDLSPAHAAAMLSCLVFTEASTKDDEVALPPELAALHRVLFENAKRVGEIMNEANLETDAEEFAKKFRVDLMEPVFQWCNGVKFSKVCELTSVFEGTIIRCVRRLVELLRQLCVAARVIGDVVLEQKFAKGIEMMKRDIIFAASLYL